MTKISMHFVSSTDDPIALAPVTIQLTYSAMNSCSNDVIMSREEEFTTDANGDLLVDLLACDRLYHVTVYDTEQETSIHHDFYVPPVNDPDSVFNLTDLIVKCNTSLSSLPYDEVALIKIIAAKLEAQAAAAISVSAKNSAQTYATQAEAAKNVAITKAAEAASSAGIATGVSALVTELESKLDTLPTDISVDGLLVSTSDDWEDVPKIVTSNENLEVSNGPMNAQAQALTNRTDVLKNRADAFSLPSGSTRVGNVAPGSGAVNRTLWDVASERVSALDYHYVVELDYAPCIQRAYDYLMTKAGGTIILPFLENGWQIITPLNFTNAWAPITLKGVGATNIPNNRPNDSTFGTTLWGNTNGSCVIDIAGRHNFGLEDLMIDTYNEAKCPLPSRIGVLSGRNTVSPDAQNHHFTNIAMFMKSTGSSVTPSIGHYGYGSELGTYTNCWYFADVPGVYTKSLLYGVSSPFTTLLPDGQSATCNVFNGMNFITNSGLGPSIRLDNTYNNVFQGTYFYNDSGNQTFPAVMMTGTNYALVMDGFSSEGHANMFETLGSMLGCRFHGWHIGEVGGSHIGKFTGYSRVQDCSFDILEGGASVAYQAYVGVGMVNSAMENVSFSLGDFGTANIDCSNGGALHNLSFKHNGGEPALLLRGGDGRFTYTINGERRSAGILKSSGPIVVSKSNMPNNSGNALFGVNVPNQTLTGQIIVNYTLNSSTQECTKTGQVVISVARVAGSPMVATIAESITQKTAQTSGAETIVATFGISAVEGGTSEQNYVFVTCVQNSSTFGYAFFRGVIELVSSSMGNDNLLDSQHIFIGL